MSGQAATKQVNSGWPGWLIMTATVAVAVRRLWPVPVLAVVLAASSIVAAAGVIGNPAVMVALALYTVAAVQSPSTSPCRCPGGTPAHRCCCR
jgi:hypothetical protein